MNTNLLKSAPLLLAGSFILCGTSAAHAQISATGGFTFTAPASTMLAVMPGQSITFSGSFKNITALDQLDNVTIGLPASYAGKFTFASPFFATLGIGQSQNFTGTLKISSAATFTSSTFYLDANGTGDNTGETYDFGSQNFTVTLAPSSNPVPEAATTVSLGLLLALGGLGLLGARRRKHSAPGA